MILCADLLRPWLSDQKVAQYVKYISTSPPTTHVCQVDYFNILKENVTVSMDPADLAKQLSYLTGLSETYVNDVLQRAAPAAAISSQSSSQ